MGFFHKNDKRKNAQRKRREREKISKLQNLEERESEFGGESQSKGTTTEREISRKHSLEEREPQIGGELELEDTSAGDDHLSEDVLVKSCL